jgi:hypothetical protein
MKDEMEQFENRLSRRPLREIPHEWRGSILAAALPTPRPAPRASFLSTFNQQLSTVFWPHPKAWAGLAAIWVLIFAVNFSGRDPLPKIAEKYSPPSPEVIVELKNQQRLFAELVGQVQPPDADRQKIFVPKPRSERAEILMT